jgi:acyl-CoA reductase-like NAD-dependent aldehyde dehydrogenase
MTGGPQPLWAQVPPAARARYLRRLAQAILDEVDDLANVLALEGGVPRTEALLAELFPSVGGLHALADDGPRALRDNRLGRSPWLRAGRRTVLVRAPVGTVGIRAGIASPWAEPVLETGAALLAGNGVVLSAGVAAAGPRLEATAGRAGLPEGLLRVSDDLSGCDAVVETGVPGPKGAVLVLDGAPLDRAIPGALWAAFARAGQGPASVGRVVVVPSAADALLEGLETAARRLRIGDPREPETEIGPLRSAAQAAEVDGLVSEAVAAGAVQLCGGPEEIGGAPFFAPAVLRSVPPDARLLREPVPGPVLAVVEAGTEAEAIALADESEGAVSIWTGDGAHGERIARFLRAELTWVNEHGFASPAAPVRLARHTVIRQLATQPRRLRSARWLPYDPDLVRASTTAARVVHGRESERFAVLRSGGPNLVKVAVRLAREQFD